MDDRTIFNTEMNIKYVESEYIKKLTERAMGYLNTGFPVHLRGAAGVGKTSLAFHIAEKIGRPVIFMCGSEEFSNFDLVGGYFGFKKAVVVDNYISSVFKKEEEMKKMWLDGRLITACKLGYTLIYDEFTRAKPEANNVLLSVLEEKIMELPNTFTGEAYLKVNPEFRVIFTSNPEEYAGVYRSPNALLDRMITVDMDIMDQETEKVILMSQSDISSKDAEKITQITRAIRSANRENCWASLRSSIMLAKVAKSLKIKIDIANPEFRQICKDIYNSSSVTLRLSFSERESYNRLIDKVINSILNAGRD